MLVFGSLQFSRVQFSRVQFSRVGRVHVGMGQDGRYSGVREGVGGYGIIREDARVSVRAEGLGEGCTDGKD